VNRKLPQAVVRYLSFAVEHANAYELRGFKTRDWQNAYMWLDNAGLTLYLLRRLQDLDATGILPPPVLSRFQRNHSNNRLRVEEVREETAKINRALECEGVKYAVVKGVSLVPQYCPDASLRAQCDLDYLVDRNSLAAARQSLHTCGYEARAITEVQFNFGKPLQRVPSRFDDPYNRLTDPMVELHISMWDQKTHRVPLNELEFSPKITTMHQWNGLCFPALPDVDAFLLQMLHVFQHLLACWVKPSWLLEIGHFLKVRQADVPFWKRVVIRLQSAPQAAEFSAITLALAEKVFAAPIPPTLEVLRQSLRPTAKLWLETYCRTWVLGDRPLHESSMFPDSKVSLFLHREYLPDIHIRSKVMKRYLLPLNKPSRIAVAVKNKPSSIVKAKWLQWVFVGHRLSFHVRSGLRYLWESRRWQRLSHRIVEGPKAISPDS
jgi:Uncharacterised nucleotidyltransferase